MSPKKKTEISSPAFIFKVIKKMPEKLSPGEIHARVRHVLTRKEITRARDWLKSRVVVDGVNLRTAYSLVRDRDFFGCRNWADYLKKFHGVKPPAKELTPEEAEKHREIHKRIEKVIQETRLTSGKHWQTTAELKELYQQARNSVIDEKKFFGHGTWENYLEKHHEVASLEGGAWSNKRIHRSIAIAAQMYKPSMGVWANSKKPVMHGKSLSELYKIAKSRNLFRNIDTFKAYVQWAIENYGTKNEVE